MSKTYRKSISKEEINKLPLDFFKGEIIIVNNEQTLVNAINEIKKHSIWGFDTETKPSFKKGQKNKIATIQLANDTKAFIFQLKKVGLNKKIIEILSTPKIIKIGLDIKQDIHKIKEIRNDFEPQGFIDIQQYAKEKGIEDLSLRKMAAIVLGKRISKKQQLSNWEKTDLSLAQKRYAATDAWIVFLLYKKLK